MSVRRLTSTDLDAIAPLVTAYPFKPYRNFRVFSRSIEARVLIADVAATVGHLEGAAILADHGDARAVVTWRRLGWDSAFFGIPMARIEHVIASALEPSSLHTAKSPRLHASKPSCLQASMEGIDACLDALRADGIRHVSARIDCADVSAIGALEARGFRLMDGLVTYIWRPGRDQAAAAVRDRGRIRLLEPRDSEALLELTTAAYRGFRGRYHLDPHVPDERADALYVEWARQCLSKEMAETVLVSEGADGKLLGFLAFRRREPVSTTTGTPIFGAGLGAGRSDAPGAYAGLIRAGTRWAHDRGGVAECQTQNYNFPTVRIYEAVGARYVRTDYTLHAWLE